jgi:hypothetical protein
VGESKRERQTDRLRQRENRYRVRGGVWLRKGWGVGHKLDW